MWTPPRLYSQNFEDLYLYRLFSGVDKGFYIDAGAWLPRTDSVTAIFYDQGWRGINIEPIKEIFDILSSERVDDVNLCLAVVDDPNLQTVPIMVVGDDPTASGHHHLLPKEQADSASLYDRHTIATKRDVPASTLREIVEKYAPSQQINFLKLDVEGFEHKALLGLDIKSLSPHHRPQVILLEATIPNTRLSAPPRHQCRDHLLSNSYKHLFCDGLNDYYCDESLYIDFAPLMLPPNLFDKPWAYSCFEIYENLAKGQEAQKAVESLSSLNNQLTLQINELQHELENKSAALAESEVALGRVDELQHELENKSAALAESEATLRQVSSRLRKFVQQ